MHKFLCGPMFLFLLGIYLKVEFLGFPGGIVVKNPPANAKDTGSIPGPGASHMPGNN